MTVIDGAVIVTAEEEVLEVSACATAVTVTVAGFGTVAGAVNKPDVLIVPCVVSPPLTPLTCHVTAVFVVFETVAENCCVMPVCTLAVGSEMEMETAGGGVVEAPLQPMSHPTAVKNAARDMRRRIGEMTGEFFTGSRSI